MSCRHVIVFGVLILGLAGARAQESGPTVGVVDPLKGGMLPGDTNALARKAGAVEKQAGNLNASLECFEQSVRFNPSLVQSWISLGLTYSERGDMYKALSSLARAVHEDPTDARAHNYLAIVANKFGWGATAQAEFEKAIALKPDYGIAYFNLALTHLDQKPPAVELARRRYEQAIKLGVEKDEIVERKLKEEP